MKIKNFVTISKYHDTDRFNREVNKWLGYGYQLFGPVEG